MEIKTKFNIGQPIHFMSGKTPKCLKVEGIFINIDARSRKPRIEYHTEGEPIKNSRFGNSYQVYVKAERKCFATREELIADYNSKITL